MKIIRNANFILPLLLILTFGGANNSPCQERYKEWKDSIYAGNITVSMSPLSGYIYCIASFYSASDNTSDSIKAEIYDPVTKAYYRVGLINMSNGIVSQNASPGGSYLVWSAAVYRVRFTYVGSDIGQRKIIIGLVAKNY